MFFNRNVNTARSWQKPSMNMNKTNWAYFTLEDTINAIFRRTNSTNNESVNTARKSEVASKNINEES